MRRVTHAWGGCAGVWMHCSWSAFGGMFVDADICGCVFDYFIACEGCHMRV